MMKPYPDYKDSGVAWLGQIPAHWDVSVVKNFYDIQLGKMLQPEKKLREDISLPYLKALHVQWFHVNHESLPEMWGQPSDIEKYGVVSGDLLVCEGGEGGRCGMVADISTPCIIQNALHRVRNKAGSHLKFLQYVMSAISSLGWFEAICSKATIAHFTKEKFGSLKIAIPPLEEQSKIAAFLDEKITKIDRFIANKRRMAALLREQKQAVITAAVTGKLNACDSCAPCGSCVKSLNANDANGARDARAWFGEIPSHWEATAVKNFYNIQLGKMLQPEKKLHDDISFPYLKALHVQWFRVEQDSLPEMWGQPSDLEKYGVKSGDLLVCEGGEGGRAAIITNISMSCIIQNALHRVRSKTGAELKFLQYVMYAISSLGWFDAICNRATIAHFTKEKFSSLKIPMPPLEEQQTIIQYIEKESHKIDTIIARTEREIALMQEYRARLIADVVTGQIDAREKTLTQTAQGTRKTQTL